MANIRQYIGARYVIKIYENSQDPSSAEWEQGNYEPLVMVTWQNGSYLSKKDVPGTVGNPASNPNYWVQTGFYNGQIASLQAQIDAINNNKLPAITAQIQSLNDNVTILSNRKIALITDSYGAIDGSTLKEEIENAFKMQVDMHAISSMGFVRSVDNRTFIDVLNDFDSDDLPYYDYLFVYGGINDYVTTSYTELYNAVNAFITSAKSIFTYSKICIFGPQSSATGNLVQNNQQLLIKNAIESACVLNGVSYCDATNWLSLSPISYQNAYIDSLHPSSQGYKIIASRMLRHLIGDNGKEILSQIFIKTHSDDRLIYSINGNVISYSILTATRDYTKNVFDILFTFNPIYVPFIELQDATPHGYYGSNYFTSNNIGTFQVSQQGGRYLPNDDYTNARIGVTGNIILFPDVVF